MPNAAYILSGELTLERKEDGKKQRVTAGQVVAEMVDALHRRRDGRETGHTDCVLCWRPRHASL